MKALHCMLDYICPKHLLYAVDDQLQPQDVQFPVSRRRWLGIRGAHQLSSPVLPRHHATVSVTPDHLQKKALIYALEVFAQLMAILALERLPPSWLAFIDNTAGEAALKKGYGKDAFVNGMLATFWGTPLPTSTMPPTRRCTTWKTPLTEPARQSCFSTSRGHRAMLQVCRRLPMQQGGIRRRHHMPNIKQCWQSEASRSDFTEGRGGGREREGTKGGGGGGENPISDPLRTCCQSANFASVQEPCKLFLA